MSARTTVFASEFGIRFEKCLQDELQRVEFGYYRQRPGVLVARGLIAPVLIAFVASVREAMRKRAEEKEGGVLLSVPRYRIWGGLALATGIMIAVLVYGFGTGTSPISAGSAAVAQPSRTSH